MTSAGLVAYNPNDPAQAAFLSSLAQGESGGSGNAAFVGTGGENLSGFATDQYGFPKWQGLGNSHAAGTFQFQPRTWDSIASKFNLNFQNPQDQAAGAWYLAQQTYAQNSGGSLETALTTGQYSSVQSALTKVWTSVTGNAAAPQGLAASLRSNIATAGHVQAANTAANNSAGAATTDRNSGASHQSSGGLFGGVANFFQRGALILIGSVIILAAIWALLAQQNIVSSPAQIWRNV